mmetsp:Transcript_32534/g.70228  ORF Transcript_32534/g.70228 Transcript_32534/m.70228 type:complete len:275 (+) Transcript_32534:123-947(+)
MNAWGLEPKRAVRCGACLGGGWLVEELLWDDFPLLDEAALVAGPPVGVHFPQVVPDLLAELPVPLLLPVPLQAQPAVPRELVLLLLLGDRGRGLDHGGRRGVHATGRLGVAPLADVGADGRARAVLPRGGGRHGGEDAVVPLVHDAVEVEVQVEGRGPVVHVQKVELWHGRGGRGELHLVFHGGGARGLELRHDRVAARPPWGGLREDGLGGRLRHHHVDVVGLRGLEALQALLLVALVLLEVHVPDGRGRTEGVVGGQGGHVHHLACLRLFDV